MFINSVIDEAKERKSGKKSSGLNMQDLVKAELKTIEKQENKKIKLMPFPKTPWDPPKPEKFGQRKSPANYQLKQKKLKLRPYLSKKSTINSLEKRIENLEKLQQEQNRSSGEV